MLARLEQPAIVIHRLCAEPQKVIAANGQMRGMVGAIGIEPVTPTDIRVRHDFNARCLGIAWARRSYSIPAAEARTSFKALLRVRMESDLPAAVPTAARRRRVKRCECVRDALRAQLGRDGVELTDADAERPISCVECP
jgi:hypothetical protein